MRQAPTGAEDVLWQRLRNRQIKGYKFRRQHALDRFIVDFYCRDANLVLEVDGPIHERQGEEDKQRQEYLNLMGFQVIRFTNEQVLCDTQNVLAEITWHLP